MRSNKQSETDTIHHPKMVARKTKRHPIDRAANRQSCSAILTDLKNRLSEIYDLNAAGSVLSWDEATYMPNGGAVSRGRQLAMRLRSGCGVGYWRGHRKIYATRYRRWVAQGFLAGIASWERKNRDAFFGRRRRTCARLVDGRLL